MPYGSACIHLRGELLGSHKNLRNFFNFFAIGMLVAQLVRICHLRGEIRVYAVFIIFFWYVEYSFDMYVPIIRKYVLNPVLHGKLIFLLCL